VKITPSERLSYRLMTSEDAQELFELDNDPAVMKFLNGGKPHSMEEIVQRWIPRMESYVNPDKGWGLWRVAIKENNTFIGWILIRPMDFFTDAPKFNDLEIGWRFKQSSWGNGYATEAATHIAESIKQNTNDITHFSALADKENLGSIAIMKKMGMSFVKEEINEDPAFSSVDVVYYTKSMS